MQRQTLNYALFNKKPTEVQKLTDLGGGHSMLTFDYTLFNKKPTEVQNIQKLTDLGRGPSMLTCE